MPTEVVDRASDQQMSDQPASLSPEHLATTLLRATWSFDIASCPLPIDPIFIAGRLGIKVYTPELEPDVSGMIVKRPGEDPEILLNASDSWNRKRFSCAHELGHYAKRISELSELPTSDWGYVDYRNGASANGNDPEEVFANQFAAALLMPAERLTGLVGLGAPALAVEFGVSADAMGYRLRNLGLS